MPQHQGAALGRRQADTGRPAALHEHQPPARSEQPDPAGHDGVPVLQRPQHVPAQDDVGGGGFVRRPGSVPPGELDVQPRGADLGPGDGDDLRGAVKPPDVMAGRRQERGQAARSPAEIEDGGGRVGHDREE